MVSTIGGKTMKRIGVFTSGGDAPGMNACIRAVVRTAASHGCAVVGVRHGFQGALDAEFVDLGPRSVSNIIQRGGTIIQTARCMGFFKKEGRAKAAANLKKRGIEGLIAIGGDGSFHGAQLLHEEHGIPTIGAPGTIDNDLFGTDYTIGYDTAVNIAVDAIDRIRDTAASHDRIFFVEVMGRHCGCIALDAGIAGGAEGILIPEVAGEEDELIETLRTGRERGKTSSIVVVSEGDEAGGAFKVAERVKKALGLPYRVTVLGHIQRGGTPTVRDRVLATRLGAAAVDALLEGRDGEMAGELGGEVVFTPFKETWEKKKKIDPALLELARILAK
jgi:6-phosphofructokinase 1